MEAIGAISRTTPAVGLLRRSLSFSLPARAIVTESLPAFGLTHSSPFVAVSKAPASGATTKSGHLLLGVDGVAGGSTMIQLLGVPAVGESPLLVRPPSIVPSRQMDTAAVRSGTFAWPQIETEEAAKRGRFSVDLLWSASTSERTSYGGRVDTGQGMSRVTVVGHRGSGKNKSKRLAWVGGVEGLPDVRENTIRSFSLAGDHGADFVEFDVQVSKDGHAVIFHDDLICTPEQGASRIGELTLAEFRKIGPQEGAAFSGKQLLRQAADGVLEPWTCTEEGPLCTLAEAFQRVSQTVGFNIEVKFLDTEKSLEEILRVVTATIANVKANAGHRRVIFSTFHPDAAILLRKLQDTYSVFFLTDGGSHLYEDPRRNSLAAAMDLCISNQLQGIVSEVTAILRQPEMIRVIKSNGLRLYTYGEENNLPEAVFFQQFQGVDGLIVDNVRPVANLAKSFSVLSAPASPMPRQQPAQTPIMAALTEVCAESSGYQSGVMCCTGSRTGLGVKQERQAWCLGLLTSKLRGCEKVILAELL